MLSMLLSTVSLAAVPAAPLRAECTAGDIDATATNISGCQVCEPGETLYINVRVTITNNHNARRVFAIYYDADGDGTRETTDYLGCLDGKGSWDFDLSTPVAVECGQEFYLNAKIQANLTPGPHDCPLVVEPHPPSQCRIFAIPVDTLTMSVPDIQVCQGTSVTEAMLLEAGASCSSGTETFDLTNVDTSGPGTTEYSISCAGSTGCEGVTETGDVTVPDCADTNACTVDSCVDGTPWQTATCEYTDVICDDGDVCTGTETCDPLLGCQAGTPLICDDGDVCTGTETCDPLLGCQPGTPLVCGDEDVCNGTETCDPLLGCQPGTPLVCDDGLFCDGTETCDPLLGCQDGTPVDCADTDICTDDSCDETANACAHVFDVTNDPSCELCYGVVCDDSLWCNGLETCNPATGLCVDGEAPDCSDGVACTIDSCDEVNDKCVNTPDDSLCDDSLFCTEEYCHAIAGCIYTPRDCSDDLFCTVNETCDEVIGACMSDPRNCADTDICTDDSCDETANACAHVFDVTNDPSCVAAPVLSADGVARCGYWEAEFSSNVWAEYYVKVTLDGHTEFEESGLFIGSKYFRDDWRLWGSGIRTTRIIYSVKVGDHEVGEDEKVTRDCKTPPPPPTPTPTPPTPTPTPTPVVEVLGVERLPVTGEMVPLSAFPSLPLILSSLALIGSGLLLRRKE